MRCSWEVRRRCSEEVIGRRSVAIVGKVWADSKTPNYCYYLNCHQKKAAVPGVQNQSQNSCQAK